MTSTPSVAAAVPFDLLDPSPEDVAFAEREDVDGNAFTVDAVDILYVSPERFGRSPQVGVPCVMPWDGLAAYLSRPTVGEAKDVAGAWCPALYQHNIRRKASLVHACALVVDIDSAGDVDRVCDVVRRYRAIVHSTFSSTIEAPRCRVVLALAERIDAATYDKAHAVVRGHLRAHGFGVDDGAKDVSRLSYSPVTRPGAPFRFRRTDGAPLDAAAIIAAQPPPPPRHAPRAPRHRDRYLRGALVRGATAVARATEGERHATLNAQAYALARLGLSESEIAAALLPAFVAAAGEHRAHEGERTIGDAIEARRKVAP